MLRSRGGRWSCSATRTPFDSTISPPSTDVSPASMRSSVVLPAPLRPAIVMRSRRSSLNETPRSSGSPAMSLARSEAIRTAMPPLDDKSAASPGREADNREEETLDRLHDARELAEVHGLGQVAVDVAVVGAEDVAILFGRGQDRDRYPAQIAVVLDLLEDLEAVEPREV